MKQLELSVLESLFRLSGLPSEEPPSMATLATCLGTGLLIELTGADFPVSMVVDPGRFEVLPEGDGVGVELD